jgi:hypothetical protein
MEPPAIIAIAATALLIVLALLSVAVGGILWCFRALRVFAPFLFIPTFALLGAAGGAWGLGLFVASVEDVRYDAPLKAALLGLPLGGLTGAVLGLLLALGLRNILLKRSTPGAPTPSR